MYTSFCENLSKRERRDKPKKNKALFSVTEKVARVMAIMKGEKELYSIRSSHFGKGGKIGYEDVFLDVIGLGTDSSRSEVDNIRRGRAEASPQAIISTAHIASVSCESSRGA